MQRHGRNWKLVKDEIPSRTTVQVRAHAQKFFNHISTVKPKEMDVISYLRSVPAESLVNVPLQNNQNEICKSEFHLSSDLIPKESESKSIKEE